jgi:hypothetical protein
MGIDIYASWRGQTDDERAVQMTGFSIEHGHAGYLREAYHGSPYVTKYLVAESFESKTSEAAIPARLLRERLPAAILLSMYRECKVYGNGDPAVISLDNGADALLKSLANIFENEIHDVSHQAFVSALTPESLETAKRLIEAGALAPVHQSFVQFVELCERVEAQTGEPCLICASY